MAGDWIKVEHALPTKGEISRMAEILKRPENEIVGALVRLWVWADANTVDGHGIIVTAATLNKRADCDGLANAMREVGWLEGRDAALSFPNYTRHNGQSSKARALATERKNKQRHGANVTKTRPEKRREYISSERGKSFADWFKKLLPADIQPAGKWQEQWAKCYDDLIADGREPEQIAKVCQWARGDAFWGSNFMSPLKLRKKNRDGVAYFDVLAEKMKGAPAAQKPVRIPTSQEAYGS